MNLQNVITGVVSVVVAVAIVGIFFQPEDGRDGRDAVGSTGSSYTETQYFNGGLTFNGSCFATTTSGTFLLSDLDAGCIDIAPAGAGQAVLSLTLPSAAQITSRFLPEVGSCRDWVIDASDVAAATTTTIVAGSGVDVVGLDATGAGTGADVIDGAEFGTMRLCHQVGGGVTAYMQEYIAAD